MPPLSMLTYNRNRDPKACRMNCRFHLASFLFVLLLAMSCVATRRTPVIPIQSVRTDTLLLHTLHYDSVFIRQERYQDRSRDTVYLHDRSVEYRYRLLRDTIREIRHDSIPYEVRIVEPSSPRLFPSLPQSLGWIALILIAGLLLRGSLSRLRHHSMRLFQ